MADVTIRGAGIFGLSIAWECLERGASVQVIDPNGVGSGASGGVVGALAPHVPENWNDKKAFQLDSLLMAERFWAGIQAASGQSPGYLRSGRLQPIVDDRALGLARLRAETAKELWQDMAVWEVIPVEHAGEWAPVSPSGWLVRDTLTARMHPRSAGAALASAIQVRGGVVVSEGENVGKVVWATGVAGLQELSDAYGKTIGNGVKGQGAVVRFDARDLPQLFADAVHIVPHENGTVAIGSTSEREYADPYGTDDQLDVVLEKAMAAVPALDGVEVIERWAGVRPRTKSRAPMLGPHPLRRGEFIANGGFKIGFGMAPKIAQVMADLVLEGRNTIPSGFAPQASL